MKGKKSYWLSNERGQKDCFTVETLREVKKIMITELKHILEDDGYISGGYTYYKRKGEIIISNGEFRLLRNRVKYLPDYTETDYC